MGLQGHERVQQQIEELRNSLGHAAGSAVRQSGKGVVRSAQRHIVTNDAVASTELYRSFRVYSSTHASSRVFNRYIIENTAEHAPFVELGTGSYHQPHEGMGPYPAPRYGRRLVRGIERWLKTKPSFRRTARGPRIFGIGGVGPSNQARAIAWNIAHPTSRDPLVGSPAQPFLGPAWETGSFRMVDNVKTSVSFTIRRVLR